MKRGVIVFDMDGVLLDVTQSYRETIRQTVLDFTGKQIDNNLIQTYKNHGGWNNDWALSERLIKDVGGKHVPYAEVVEHFQKIFFGEGDREGLIMREQWLPVNGFLERLASRHRLAIFTGRLREEAFVSLNRFVPGLQWDAMMADDDVVEKKPHPEGLLRIAEQYRGEPIVYIGDTVDDARAAIGAKVPFVGIVHDDNPRRDEARRLLKANGAIAVYSEINETETELERALANG